MHVTSLQWFFPVFNGLFLGVLAMTLHEVSHLVAALAVGVKVKKIGFRWKGLYMVREAGSPAKNALVSLAGPLANLALLLSWHWSPTFGMANLCFTFFNLLPLQGSDGERVWQCWREMHKDKPRPVKGVIYRPSHASKPVVVAYPASVVSLDLRRSWPSDSI